MPSLAMPSTQRPVCFRGHIPRADGPIELQGLPQIWRGILEACSLGDRGLQHRGQVPLEEERELEPIRDAHVAKRPRQMSLDGPLADLESVRYLLIGCASTDET